MKIHRKNTTKPGATRKKIENSGVTQQNHIDFTIDVGKK